MTCQVWFHDKIQRVDRKWLQKNDLWLLLFSEKGLDATHFLSPVISPYSARTTATPAIKTETDIRSAVLRCVADLSLDELDNILLPLLVVLKHFKPRD